MKKKIKFFFDEYTRRPSTTVGRGELIDLTTLQALRTILNEGCNQRKLCFSAYFQGNDVTDMQPTPPLDIVGGHLASLARDGIIRLDSRVDLTTVSRLVHESPHTRISNLFELGEEAFWEVLSDRGLHYTLRQIFPNGYHCTTFSSNNLRKGVDERGWHCDYPYHNLQSPYAKETLGVQVIWALDDFTHENGATWFVPGSHRKLSFPPRDVKDPHKLALVKKGDIILYLGKLWHTQGINTTDVPRGALLANFSPLNIPAKDNIASTVSPEKVKDGMVQIGVSLQENP